MPWIVGAMALGVLAALFMGLWQERHQALVDAELERERGRVWGMTCAAVHRAVQAGRVTVAGQVTLAQLISWRSVPAGIRPADQAGQLTARYGAVLAGGAPLAACSLSGPGMTVRSPHLREGALMAGLDLVGFVDGTATPMHDRLADVEAVLGTLPAGSMFATADFGIGHAAERVHRRTVGGRPELSSVEQDVGFGENVRIVGAGAVSAERARADGGTGPATGRVDADGDVVVAEGGSLDVQAATTLSADGDFAFGGGTQTAWTIDGELAVGTSLRSRGEVGAGSLDVSAGLVAGGALTVGPGGSAGTGTLTVSGGVNAVDAAFSGTLDVRPGGCTGCVAPPVGP